MKFVRFFLKIVLILIFLAALSFVSGKLFLEEKTDQLIIAFKNRYFVSDTTARSITIALSSSFTDFNTWQNEVSANERLLHIYEGLTRVNAFLEIEPALAVSFGALNDLTWEFRLRRGVKFHDGSLLKAEDVIFSIDSAQKNTDSGLSSFLASIEKIEKIDDERFHIVTKSPDPLLLQKLALVFIVPKHAKNLEIHPIGTGPFLFSGQQEDGEISLTRFDDYWGKKPAISNAKLLSIPDREKRKAILKNGSVDLMTNVPPEVIPELQPKDPLEIITAPALESNFLLFGFHGIFDNRKLRKAVSLAIDREEIVRLAFGFAKPASQFVGKGIFGFQKDIEIPKPDVDLAKELVGSVASIKEKVIRIDLPDGFQALGKFLLERLKKIGLKAEAQFHNPEKLEEIILEGKSDIFFFGWRSSLGDAGGLFGAILHSRKGEYGYFNVTGYRNEEIDGLIEDSDITIHPMERLAKLRRIMEITVTEDILGIPLFIPETVYAKRKEIIWNPRIDSYILAQEVDFSDYSKLKNQ